MMNNLGNTGKPVERIGNYRIEKRLSDAGGFAVVYLGRHVVFEDRPLVAIKLLRIERASPDQYNRFLYAFIVIFDLDYLPVLLASNRPLLPQETSK